jgi:hypothetical protein
MLLFVALFLFSAVYEEYVVAASLFRDQGGPYPVNEGNKKLRSVFFTRIYFSEATRSIFQNV